MMSAKQEGVYIIINYLFQKGGQDEFKQTRKGDNTKREG